MSALNPESDIKAQSFVPEPGLFDDPFEQLYKTQLRRAWVRSGASAGMWLFALLGIIIGIIDTRTLAGISIAVGVVVLINPPLLWFIKHAKKRYLYTCSTILTHAVQIAAYTTIMHFLGGIEATYLIPIYGALITYDGVVSAKVVPFITATACSAAFSLMVVLERLEVLPHHSFIPVYSLPLGIEIIILLVVFGLLQVVAFISSYTADLLKKNRDALGRKNAELELVVKRAVASDRIKSEFLANMSHELRTPLNHIIGFTELVLDKNFGDLNETQEEYLGDVHLSSKHLLSLINDVLDLSKVESGKMELDLSWFNLRSVLEQSLVMTKEKALKHGIEISTRLDGIPETIRADERRVKQILYNLLSNSMKFTPDGGRVELNARTCVIENADSQTASDNSQAAVEISVADTGIGLRSEDMKRVFKPFEQVENSASRKFPGTGLGLSLTRKLVELHGGRIWAESPGEGKGATFTFVIPV